MAKVHMITLISGEYDDVMRLHGGAYLDYNTAIARVRQLEDLITKYRLDREGMRQALRDDRDTSEEEQKFIDESGLDFCWVSYTGIAVYLDSYDLLG